MIVEFALSLCVSGMCGMNERMIWLCGTSACCGRSMCHRAVSSRAWRALQDCKMLIGPQSQRKRKGIILGGKVDEVPSQLRVELAEFVLALRNE